MTMRMLSVSLLLCAVMVLTTAGPAVKNVARVEVAQSSVGAGGHPERAIDGNRASLWWQNSCTHTQKETTPWWRVDLRKTYKVHSVKITNRKDCCSERIHGAEIRIGNSLNDNGNGNPRCAVIDSIPAGNTKTFTCNGMEGQFVNIVIRGKAQILTLCEVEVFGTEKEDDVKNVARGGQVAQSSLGAGGHPERAIDGNRASVYSKNSCTHTQKETSPWWSVNLRKTYKVNSVKITNRKDCCAERINGAEIRIGNSLNDNGNGNPRCAVIDSIPAGFTRTFTCNGMEGQFVNIVIPGRAEWLTLCEVEVFGTEKEDDAAGCVKCLNGWNEHCYIFEPVTMTWADAEKTCLSMGGHLASILSKTEHTFIQDLIRSKTGAMTHAWIGGNDVVGKNAAWKWSDGRTMTFTDWGKGEPNGQYQNCMLMNWSGDHLWDDQVCIRKFASVCKIPVEHTE